MFRYAYLHGFASSPGSFKGNVLAAALERHGVFLERPDLNAPSFRHLTVTDMLDALDRLDAASCGDEPWRFIGSSLGGYLAALWAAYNPFRVDRLVLLAPAFRLEEHLDRLTGPGGRHRWEMDGSFPFPDAEGKRTPVHFGFVEDLRMYPPCPEVTCPTLILHGVQDRSIPVETSRDYALPRPHVRLVEVQDDHELRRSIFQLEREILSFFHLDQGDSIPSSGGQPTLF